MEKQGQQTTRNEADEINYQKLYRTEPTNHYRSKKIEREHIKEQMGDIHVQEARSYHSFLLTSLYGIDTELVSIKKSCVTETAQRN